MSLAICLRACALAAMVALVSAARQLTSAKVVRSEAREFDYFMFVRQWPGNYCSKHSCPLLHDHGFHFTIHGLWPNYNDGTWPQFCHTDYKFDDRKLSDIEDELEEEWPSFMGTYDTFWEHEWSKHGTCALNVLPSEHAFFKTVLDMHERYDLAAALRKADIVPSATAVYRSRDLVAAIQDMYGAKPLVHCYGKELSEIWMCVGKDLKPFDCDTAHESNTCEELSIPLIDPHTSTSSAATTASLPSSTSSASEGASSSSQPGNGALQSLLSRWTEAVRGSAHSLDRDMQQGADGGAGGAAAAAVGDATDNGDDEDDVFALDAARGAADRTREEAHAREAGAEELDAMMAAAADRHPAREAANADEGEEDVDMKQDYSLTSDDGQQLTGFWGGVSLSQAVQLAGLLDDFDEEEERPAGRSRVEPTEAAAAAAIRDTAAAADTASGDDASALLQSDSGSSSSGASSLFVGAYEAEGDGDATDDAALVLSVQRLPQPQPREEEEQQQQQLDSGGGSTVSSLGAFKPQEQHQESSSWLWGALSSLLSHFHLGSGCSHHRHHHSSGSSAADPGQPGDLQLPTGGAAVASGRSSGGRPFVWTSRLRSAGEALGPTDPDEAAAAEAGSREQVARALSLYRVRGGLVVVRRGEVVGSGVAAGDAPVAVEAAAGGSASSVVSDLLLAAQVGCGVVAAVCMAVLAGMALVGCSRRLRNGGGGGGKGGAAAGGGCDGKAGCAEPLLMVYGSKGAGEGLAVVVPGALMERQESVPQPLEQQLYAPLL